MQPEDQNADNNNNNNVIGTLNCRSKIQTEKAPTLLSKESHNMHKLSKDWSHWCLAGDK